MQIVVINIGGMTCMGCASSVKNVLEQLPGVRSAEVSLEDAQVTVQHDAAVTSVEQLRQAIEEAGFEAIA